MSRNQPTSWNTIASQTVAVSCGSQACSQERGPSSSPMRYTPARASTSTVASFCTSSSALVSRPP